MRKTFTCPPLVGLLLSVSLIGLCVRDAWASEVPLSVEIVEQQPRQAADKEQLADRKQAERAAKKAAKLQRRAQKTARRAQKTEAADTGQLRERFENWLAFGFGIVVGIGIGKHMRRVSARRDSWSGDG